MLLAAACLNIGDYTKSIRLYSEIEKDISGLYAEPDLNIKLGSIFLNMGICYIYLNNYNISEKWLRKGLSQLEGILNNDIVYKVMSQFNIQLIADINENLGIIYEANIKPKEAMNHYKKALKIKFNYFGENNDEVLDLQYKISSVYLSMRQVIQ